MKKPCMNNEFFCDCHICHLFKTNIRYRKLWGGDDNVQKSNNSKLSFADRTNLINQRKQRANTQCVNLGIALETTASCGCGGAVKHSCSVHGECRKYGNDNKIANCSNCLDYKPVSSLTVDELVDILTSKKTLIGSTYHPEQTYAVRSIIEELRSNLPEIPSFKSKIGVVTTGGGKYWPGTWIQARMLRELGWVHPIQAWYLGDNEKSDIWQKKLSELNVETIDAIEFSKNVPYRILNGFEVKLYAYMNSGIEQPLWLDSDCYPCRHPGMLWDCQSYKQTGSIHWPDLANSETWTRWDKWGVEKDDSPPIETGQFIYNLKEVWEEANIALKLNELSDIVYHWDYGDKGPARVAWAWTRKKRTIYQKVPSWIGPAFVHVANDLEPILIHRCRGKAQTLIKNQFYTPQNSDGESNQTGLPGECMYQKFLLEAKSIAK